MAKFVYILFKKISRIIITNQKFLFISGDIGNYYYGQGHPMKPHRIRMTHNLLLNYGLYRKMEIYVSIKLIHNIILPKRNNLMTSVMTVCNRVKM